MTDSVVRSVGGCVRCLVTSLTPSAGRAGTG